jgi:hypothetical protein
MFRRRWLWFGKLVSDEGFSLAYGNKSVTYSDDRGSFQFGFEDGLLFPTPTQLTGKPVSLDEPSLSLIIERVVRGIRSEGHAVDVYSA